MNSITIKGAQLHNLKGFDISIPKNKLIVVTGVSGSGKSSLAFDIIFEEGRRQYLQSLGALTSVNEEEKFESISGISPTVAVQQNIIRQSNPRATVGTKTNILNLLSALFASEGTMICTNCGQTTDKNLYCNNCDSTEERLGVGYFSYNNANGMCMTCAGKGAVYEINFDKLIPSEKTSLEQVCTNAGVTTGLLNVLRRRLKDYMEVPFWELPDEIKEDVVYGQYVNGNYQKRSFCLSRHFEGLLYRGEDVSELYSLKKCTDCNGYRLGEEALRVQINGKHIGELCTTSVTELHSFLIKLEGKQEFTAFGNAKLLEIIKKLESLIKSKLGYLTLYREIPSLSGGELQRLFLNSHLESEMDSLIYVLDEPTSGLHESEKEDLLNSISQLKDLGNTVLIVEHDKKTIEVADHIIDIGPKAGIEGGHLIFQGNIDGLLKSKNSISGSYLSSKKVMYKRERIEMTNNTSYLTIRNAQTNNLKNLTVSIPLGRCVGIAGVSGSGKSSLISDTLVPLLKSEFKHKKNKQYSSININNENDTDCEVLIETIADKLKGTESISGYAEVSQEPIGRNMNSNPITYVGIWEKIRKLYAMQLLAKKNNLSPGHFSFNSKGACVECNGSGKEKIWMGGNLFIYNTCKQCKGKRYTSEALSVTYQNKNIYDVLEMNVSEALSFFKNEKTIFPMLEVLEKIGMGYIKLGQPTPTLSGGEAQRIKLAKEIGRKRKGNILYIMDEPTSGLSLYDTSKLIELLDELVKKGNSVVVIEHDTEVLSSCDWIIELGPNGGNEGGQLIAEGYPENLNENSNSLTGKYLN